MADIIQIPTEKNVAHLWKEFSGLVIQRNNGLPISANEVLRKEQVFAKVLNKMGVKNDLI